MFRKSVLLMLALLGFVVTGCNTVEPGGAGSRAQATGVQTPRSEGGNNSHSRGLDTFTPGQKITIEFTDVPGAPPPFSQTVLQNGDILLPMDQRIKATGKSKSQLVKEIQALYVPKLYRRLTVNIQSEDRWYYVAGEVKNPSQRPYVGDLTVLKAIQSAGDFTNFAKEQAVEVTRADGKLERVDCKKARQNAKYDLPVYPGDSIYVPKSWY